MPMGDGTGPPGEGGPGTGRGRGFRGGQGAGKEPANLGGGRNKSESLIAIIGGAIALATSIVKLLSRKKQDEKK